MLEVQLCERFGWTFLELDEQDEMRILPAVAAANTQAAIERVVQSMDSKWKSPLTDNDWMLYNYAVKLRQEVYE